MGKNISHIDEKVGAGHSVKGLNNLLYGCNLLLAIKASQSFEKAGIDPVKAMSAVYASSGGSNCNSRVLEFVSNNRNIDYSFKAQALLKDMDIGLSLIDKID